MATNDAFGTFKTLDTPAGKLRYADLGGLEKRGMGAIARLPYSVRILLESVLRNVDGYQVKEADVSALAAWKPKPGEVDVPFNYSARRGKPKLNLWRDGFRNLLFLFARRFGIPMTGA